jgi:hypothetical protein
MQPATWTNPYYGVQHLTGLPVLEAKMSGSHVMRAQVTVTDRGMCATLMRWDRGMRPLHPELVFKTVEKARKAGEAWALALEAIR